MALLRLRPTLDFVRVQDVGLSRVNYPDIRGVGRREPHFPALIDDLPLLDNCSDNEEWINRITYLPLR